MVTEIPPNSAVVSITESRDGSVRNQENRVGEPSAPPTSGPIGSPGDLTSSCRPHQLLVLPFVPHPTQITIPASQTYQGAPRGGPPPNYFTIPTCGASYLDPPPDYDSLANGRAPSTQGSYQRLTFFDEPCRSTLTSSCGGQEPSNYPYMCYVNHGADLGQCGRHGGQGGHIFYTNESCHAGRHSHQDDDDSTTSVDTLRPRGSESGHFSVKKWILVVLVLTLFLTFSLLLGISFQHFQLLRTYASKAGDKNRVPISYHPRHIIPKPTTELPYDCKDDKIKTPPEFARMRNLMCKNGIQIIKTTTESLNPP